MRIEQAGPDDVEALARLLRLDTLGGDDLDPGDLSDDGQIDSFTADLAAWWRPRTDSFVAFVARADSGAVVGMAWVAMAARVPRPGAIDRCTGDIQSVYVLPEHRGRGAGSALVEAAARHAERAGAARVTVSSGRRALPIYQRLGFASSPRLLQRPMG